jgi:hypothetical protein
VRGLILLSAFGRHPRVSSWSRRVSLGVLHALGIWACNARCDSGAFSACPALWGSCIRAISPGFTSTDHSRTWRVTARSGHCPTLAGLDRLPDLRPDWHV